MVLFGLILLLPGGCALYFITLASGSLGSTSDAIFWIGLWGVCLAISASGIGLVVKAFR